MRTACTVHVGCTAEDSHQIEYSYARGIPQAGNDYHFPVGDGAMRYWLR